MRKTAYFLSVLCIFAFSAVSAQEEPEVNDDAFLVQKAITVWSDASSSQKVITGECQAVRIAPGWFLTAAHCVYDFCRADKACTIRIDLVSSSDPLAAQVRVHSDSSVRNVFIYPGYNPRQNRSSSFDAALIRFAPKTDDFVFFNPREQKPLSRSEFEKQLDFYPESRAQWNASRPKLLTFDAAVSARLTRPIVVPRVNGGALSWLYNPAGQAYFVSELQHFVSTSFGVQQGNSGGGVFTADGQLVGIVSMTFQSKGGHAAFKDADGQPLPTIHNADSYFVFTGFTSGVTGFIRSHVPSFQSVGAVPQAAELTSEKFNRIIKVLDGATAG